MSNLRSPIKLFIIVFIDKLTFTRSATIISYNVTYIKTTWFMSIENKRSIKHDEKKISLKGTSILKTKRFIKFSNASRKIVDFSHSQVHWWLLIIVCYSFVFSPYFLPSASFVTKVFHNDYLFIHNILPITTTYNFQQRVLLVIK